MLVTRKVMNLQDYITLGHIEAMNKVIVLGVHRGLCLSHRIVHGLVWRECV